MKKIFLFISIFSITQFAYCQEIAGDWSGVLKVQGGATELRLVFHISQTPDGLSVTLDSPDQAVKGISVEKATFENQQLTLSMPASVEYKGVLSDNQEIIGTFTQRGISFPLTLTRGTIVLRRPQEPQPPYPYRVEEVSFGSLKSDVRLSGTLTLPEGDGKFPAVVLVSGSGAQNRDEEILGHKPFLVLADYLTRNGIAVLRYDDRGTGKSTGNFSSSTTYDFSKDAEGAFNFLKNRKEINKKSIGIIGHSEGGIVAPMIAARNKKVGFIVLLAAPAMPLDSLLLLQNETIAKAMGVSAENLKTARDLNREIYQTVKNEQDTVKLKEKLAAILENKVPNAETYINQVLTNWVRYFVNYNPAPVFEKLKIPVLALNGEKDLQVPYNENLTPIKTALEKGGNQRFTIKLFPDLNHLFQSCTTGLPSEYGQIEETMSENVLQVIAEWIKKL